MRSLAGQHQIDRVSETVPGGLGASRRGLLDLPKEERPRERLARLGAEALSTRELVTVLVGTGARGAAALDLADELLGSGLHSLAGRALPDLERLFRTH